MFRRSILKRIAPVVIAGLVVTAAQSVAAQSVIDRLKRAAEEAARKAEEAKKGADAKRAAEKEKATPATPGGGNPNANSPNAATPATPAGGANAGQSNPRASSAKVDEQVLASGQNLSFVVGPKGGHAAAVVLRGSRTVVMHDGVDGPRFDAIIGDSEGLVFSPDGSRLAYLARQGAEYVFVVDGKETLRVPVAAHPQVGPTGSRSIPQFTANSRHVFFQLYTEAPGESTGNGAHRLFVDGVPGPESHIPPSPIFAAGGDHHTYLVESRQKRGTFALVVDGKLTAIAGGEPQMTADGLHVFTKRVVPGGAVDVLLDGKPIMRAQSPLVYTTPVGSGFMTVVTQGSPGSGIHFLTMGTQRIPGTDCPWNPGYSNIAFSPDAKHWVAVCQASASSFWIVADGKKGQEYQGIIPVGFAADGRFVYGANMRNQTFLVVGDQESEGYTSMLSPISTGVTGTVFQPMLNHSPMPPPATLVGNHIAFNAQTGGSTLRTIVVTRTLNVDGKDLPGNVVTFQQPAITARVRHRAEFVFSAAGKRVAYFDMQPDNASGIYVEGKLALVFPGTQPQNLTFTPDGRHLLWLAADGNGQTVYVDGRPAVRFDGNYLMQNSPGTWEMGADGTLTVVAQAGDAIKRFRITPGTDTTVDDLGK